VHSISSGLKVTILIQGSVCLSHGGGDCGWYFVVEDSVVIGLVRLLLGLAVVRGVWVVWTLI